MAGALGAYKVMFLTDVEGWLRDPDDPASVVSEASAGRGRGGARRRWSGGMRPKLQACVDAIDGGVTLLAHRRRPRPALAAARAVHRRRHRHEDRAHEPCADARRRSSASASSRPTRGCPVEFVRGRGRTPVGRRGQRVPRLPRRDLACSNVGHCHPARGRGGARAGGAPHARHQPLLHRAGDAAARAAVRALARRQGVLLQLAAPRPSRRRSSSCARRAAAARSWSCRAPSTAARTARCRPRRRSPSRRRSRRSCPGFVVVPKDPAALDAAVDEEHRGGAARADPGRDGRSTSCSDELLHAARDGLRSHRARRCLRRDPVRHGPHRHAVGLRARPASRRTR